MDESFFCRKKGRLSMTVTAVNGLLKAQQQWLNPTGDAHPLQLLILNLMPTKAVTERQFLDRFAAVSQAVNVTFMYPASHHFKGIDRQTVADHCVTLADVYDRHFDGLIITGAPVECLPFEAVDYWQEFEQIVDWGQTHATQTLFECWAAQAGLYYQFDIKKQVLPQKVFGIYAASTVATNSRLVSGLSAGGLLKMPQSRHTQLDLPTTLPTGLQIIAENDQVGPLLLSAPTKHAVYVTGHPEYAAATLATEYRRDCRKHLPIQLPENYFENVQTGQIDYSWRDASCQLYQNWLATLQLTKVGN